MRWFPGPKLSAFAIATFAALVLLPFAHAQESTFFVTYDHHMEEFKNLELSTTSTAGLSRNNLPNTWGQLFELEYGVTDRWTTSLYLDSSAQRSDAIVFNGFRFENRYRVLKQEHKINPVVYFEYENINEADRNFKEVVGHAEADGTPLSVLRGTTAREIEGKLILSSDVKGWNISENVIFEKNLSEEEGVEFGYAWGMYHPLGKIKAGRQCTFCRQNFLAGFEMYGGLGSTEQFGLKETEHYLAPGILWSLGNSKIKFEPAFGLNGNSSRALLRIGYTYEINGFGDKVKKMFK
jgi:hypothetical protein